VASRRTARKPPTEYKLSVRVDPEVRKQFKLACTRDDTTIADKLHEMICREIGREDLLLAQPVASAK
jgi:hypothetical protein